MMQTLYTICWWTGSQCIYTAWRQRQECEQLIT